MTSARFNAVILFCFGAFALSAGAEPPAQDVLVVAKTSVQTKTPAALDNLQQLVADFAARNGFSKGEHSTLPKNRKTFDTIGGFNITFRGPGDAYLVMQYTGTGGCVPIQIYSTQDAAKYRQLLDSLDAELQKQLKDIQVFPDTICGTPDKA